MNTLVDVAVSGDIKKKSRENPGFNALKMAVSTEKWWKSTAKNLQMGLFHQEKDENKKKCGDIKPFQICGFSCFTCS